MAKMTRTRSPVAEQLDGFISAVSEKKLKAGWFESNKYPDGTSVAMVAATQEFGDERGHVPPRPFMRTTAAEKKGEWARQFAGASKAIMAGQITTEDAFTQLGGMVVGDVQKKIKSITDPPLAESTIKRKGSSKPLVESGLMLQTMTHVTE